MTLEFLHHEYLEQHPGGYRYTQFCDIYRQWVKKQRLSMRQVHRAGEKLFSDYAGQKPHIVDPATGECVDVELFVAVLGASNFTYAEATRTQRVPDWIASHVRALEFFGGVPGAIVPDQLKSGVTSACRYEPEIQRTYEEFAAHYGTTILPARPASPRDKAKVEVAVQIAERWILARLRHETFFSLAALNERIAELLVDLNNRRMRLYGASRRELFERLDRPALKPLPCEPFLYGEWKNVRVNIDYHVEIDHRNHLEWSPSRIIRWAGTIGPHTQELVGEILAERPHPEQGYRSCLGILRLERRYGRERLEAACARAVAVRARSYRHVDSILKHGLDRVALVATPETGAPLLHGNLRGAEYYR